ncbi:MAG: PQQ-binding-like beta-propeller repeat protein, partial [Halobacteria archaeon]|nr:PQQ-binding-like beta-propeller repeat protein [Halobacteria archaeon]
VGGRGIMRHSIGLSTEIEPGETLSEEFTLHFDTRGLESGGYVIQSGFENNATEEPRTYKTRFTIEPKSTERVKVETPAQCDTLPEFNSPKGTWNGFGYDPGNTGYSPEMRGPTDSVQVKWSYETDSRLEASPAVSDDYVYFIDKQGVVYSLDKSNGEKVWDFSTGAREGGLEWSPMGASPTLVDDTLYIAFGDLAPSSPDAGREALLNGTDLYLYALDAETGKEKWKYRVPSVPNSTPKVVGGTVYFTTENGVVHAVDATEGEKTWEFSTGAGIRSTPAVGDCSVFIGGGENKELYSIDAGDGSLKWEFKTDGELTASPAYRDGTVYFGSNGRGTLYAVDSSNGKEKWSKSLRGSVVRSSPAVTENQVFIGDFSRGVYAFRRDDGKQLWRAPTRGYVWSSPAVTRDAVYCADLENMVFGLDRETGDELWSYETGDNVRSSPAVSNGVVYVAGTDGKLYAFSA